jgi:hypothetical protein
MAHRCRGSFLDFGLRYVFAVLLLIFAPGQVSTARIRGFMRTECGGSTGGSWRDCARFLESLEIEPLAMERRGVLAESVLIDWRAFGWQREK